MHLYDIDVSNISVEDIRYTFKYYSQTILVKCKIGEDGSAWFGDFTEAKAQIDSEMPGILSRITDDDILKERAKGYKTWSYMLSSTCGPFYANCTPFAIASSIASRVIEAEIKKYPLLVMDPEISISVYLNKML